MSNDTVAVQLEGWLPGEENNGLPGAGPKLLEDFEDAYRTGRNTTEATLTLVVGFVEVVGVKHRKNPEEKPPVVATRFARLEVVKPGEAHAKVKAILDDIHNARNGTTVLPAFEKRRDGQPVDADDTGPEIAAAARERAAAKKTAAKKTAGHS